MDRLKALWGRLGKTERIAIGLGIPLVALAAIISSRRAKPAEPEEDAELKPTGVPQSFGPNEFDIMRILDEALKKVDDAVDKVPTKLPDPPAAPPVTVVPPTVAPVAPNLQALSHADLVLRADNALRDGGAGPYIDEIMRRFRAQGSGPDGTMSVNGSYWRTESGYIRDIWWVVQPKVLALLPPGTWENP